MLQLNASTNPSNAYITWISTDTSIATVSTGGKVTAVANGVTAIIADVDGAYDVCVICVITTSQSNNSSEGDNINIIIDVASLPEGAVAIQMLDGSVIYFDGRETLNLSMPNAGSAINFVVLGKGNMPLSTVSVEAADNTVIIPVEKSGQGYVWPILMWVLMSIAAISLLVCTVLIITAKRWGKV